MTAVSQPNVLSQVIFPKIILNFIEIFNFAKRQFRFFKNYILILDHGLCSAGLGLSIQNNAYAIGY